MTDQPRTTLPPMLGKSGLQVFSGQVLDDFLREWRYPEAYKKADEMRRNSPVIAALLLAIENGIRSIEFHFTSDRVQAGAGTDPRLDLLTESLAGMSHSLNDHLSEALTMLPFGFAPFAIWYKRDERGRIVWRKFLLLGQDTVYRWEFDDEGGLRGLWQQGLPGYQLEFIPIERLLLYRTRVERNNPEGRSILRPAWIPYYYAKNISRIEAIGVERDLAGLPMIRPSAAADLTAGSTDYETAHRIVRNVRRDEQDGLIIPPGWDFSLLSTGGSRQFDTDQIINRYDTRQLQAALAQFLMLGQEGEGSLALSRDQTDFFTMSLNTVADLMAEVLGKFAAPRLLALNGYPADGIGCEHSPAGDVDLERLGAFLEQVMGAKLVTWTPQDEAWLRQVGKLPDLSPEEIEAAQEQKRAEALEIAQATRPAAADDTERGQKFDAALARFNAAINA